MSRVLSFRDLKLITELAPYTEISLLDPSMDERVNYYLDKLGFDVEYGICYEPSLHRDMRNKVAVGFRVVGELNVNRNIINSDLCTLEDRLIAAAYLDPTLVRELSPLMGTRLDYRAFHAEDAESEDNEDFLSDDIEPDYEMIKSQIEALTAIRDSLRGSVYNEAGSIKSPAENFSHK
jgi:hypothetical protein